MTVTNQSIFSSTLVIALAVTASCSDTATTDVSGSMKAALESGEVVEKSMTGPARYTAEWAQELFPGTADFYIYKDGDLVRGAVFFSDYEICQFQDITLVNGKAMIHSEVCSGAIAGATLDVSCRPRANGNFACSGHLVAPQGETGTGTMYSQIVYAYESAYEGPRQPSPDLDQDGNCPGSRSFCGTDGCCAPFERCGDGQCWMPVNDKGGIE